MRTKQGSIGPEVAGTGSPGPSEEAVTIPGVLLNFLDRASAAIAATRNTDLIPYIHQVVAWHVGADRRTITCLVSKAFTPNLVESLEDNGEFAVTIEEIGPHETYQFKGRFLDARAVDDGEDRHAFERVRERYVRAVVAFTGFPEERVRTFIRTPDIAVRFEVREIFVQTPGPGAGTRLVPREET